MKQTAMSPDERARTRACTRIAAMTAIQIGTPQTCAFCGRDYALTAEEPYRPGAVCAECWPKVSAIEQPRSRDGISERSDFDDAEQHLEDEWELGDYDNGDTGCPHCGRFRLCLCPNGNHRCEKCNWSPEIDNYAPVPG